MCTWAASPQGKVVEVSIGTEEDKAFIAQEQGRFPNGGLGGQKGKVTGTDISIAS